MSDVSLHRGFRSLYRYWIGVACICGFDWYHCTLHNHYLIHRNSDCNHHHHSALSAGFPETLTSSLYFQACFHLSVPDLTFLLEACFHMRLSSLGDEQDKEPWRNWRTNHSQTHLQHFVNFLFVFNKTTLNTLIEEVEK